jgi:acyl-CoA synthetase (AMP-forming)/AMP-acid ligase II
VGRRKELIIKNGFNVYPPEIEAALTAIPGIALAAVIGKHRLGTELIVAFVETHPVDFELDLREVNEQLRATLSGYKLLDELHVLPQLPASPSGKVLKHRL